MATSKPIIRCNICLEMNKISTLTVIEPGSSIIQVNEKENLHGYSFFGNLIN